MVVPAGMGSAPLPPIVPPVHVIAEPGRVIGAGPASGPPFIVSTGIDCAEALLMARVPPDTRIDVEIGPATVFVPDWDWIVPAPLMVEAASNERTSFVLKMRFVPLATLNVAPVLVIAPM